MSEPRRTKASLYYPGKKDAQDTSPNGQREAPDPTPILLLQPQEFDTPVFVPPRLGVRLLRRLVPPHVVIHQRRRPRQPQLRLLQRRLQQPHRPVQGQLRRFFWSRFRTTVTNRCASPTSVIWWCQPTHDRVSYCAIPR